MMFYYTASGKTFYNRDLAVLCPEKCYFYYYDKEFRQYDWTKEPSCSLEELYQKRAEQLRAEYEYLVLCYSGGIDSTKVLEIFYYNNIPIDEIIMIGALSQDSSKNSYENNNQDLYYNAFPTIEKLNPKCKITIFDYSKYFNNINNFSLVECYGDEYYKYCGSYFSPNHLFWSQLTRYIDYGDKKTAVIFGTDKPILRYDDKSYFALKEQNFTDYGKEHFWTLGCSRVNFYTDINCMDLMAKQFHILKNFYQEFVLDKKIISQELWLNPEFYNRILDNTVYKLRNRLTIPTKKSTSSLISRRDRFLLNATKNCDMFKLYSSMIRKVKTSYGNIEKHFMTVPYYLE